MKTEVAKKKAMMRRGSVRLGDVRRDAAGNVTMIDFVPYQNNESAPAIFVNGVGGVYKIGPHSIQVTFIKQIRNADGDLETKAEVHLIWDEKAWLDGGKLFRFAMSTYEAGYDDDGGGGPPQ
jgi:hypothetical protein